MRAGKLMTLAAVAVLAGGAGIAANVATAEQSPHSSSSIHGGASHSMHGAFGRALEHDLGGVTAAEEHAHMREMMRNVPRLSSVGTELRIDAHVPRSVQQAAAPLPAEIQRRHPHLRNSRAFIYHDKFVLLNPAARIVAIVKKPS
jgi:hypothetical protein